MNRHGSLFSLAITLRACSGSRPVAATCRIVINDICAEITNAAFQTFISEMIYNGGMAHIGPPYPAWLYDEELIASHEDVNRMLNSCNYYGRETLSAKSAADWHVYNINSIIRRHIDEVVSRLVTVELEDLRKRFSGFIIHEFGGDKSDQKRDADAAFDSIEYMLDTTVVSEEPATQSDLSNEDVDASE